MEKLKLSDTDGGKTKWYKHFGKQFGISLKELPILMFSKIFYWRIIALQCWFLPYNNVNQPSVYIYVSPPS